MSRRRTYTAGFFIHHPFITVLTITIIMAAVNQSEVSGSDTAQHESPTQTPPTYSTHQADMLTFTEETKTTQPTSLAQVSSVDLQTTPASILMTSTVMESTATLTSELSITETTHVQHEDGGPQTDSSPNPPSVPPSGNYATLTLPIMAATLTTTAATTTTTTSSRPQSVAPTIPCLPFGMGMYISQIEGEVVYNSFDSPPVSQCPIKRWWTINVPPGYGVTVKIFDIVMYGNFTLGFYSGGTDDQNKLLRTYTQHRLTGGFSPILSRDSSLVIVLTEAYPGYGRFNISFVGHPFHSWPLQADFEVVRSSIETYACNPNGAVPRVFRCDMVEQCVDGKDEEDCDYKEDGTCGDWIPYGEHCLKAWFLVMRSSIPGHTQITMPLQAERECQEKYGATLAILPDKKGTDLVANMIRHSGYFDATIGLQKVKPQSKKLRHLYRFLWQWGDRGSPVAYMQQSIQRAGPLMDCSKMKIYPASEITPLPCSLPKDVPSGLICMKRNPTKDKQQPEPVMRAEFVDPLEKIDQFPTKECWDGSRAQTFHQCAWAGLHPQLMQTTWSESNLPLFQCQFGQTVHYSLVCDGNPDCADASDEFNCVIPRYPPLLETTFYCREGSETIHASLRCNGRPDCFGESDEEYCVTCTSSSTVMCAGVGCVPNSYAQYIDSCPIVAPTMSEDHSGVLPATLSLDGTGMSYVLPVIKCSESEFPCHNGLCIPAFLVNNGEQDCGHGEDEGIPKDNVTCPGYYRCQDVGICLHKTFLCDGINHCPNKDDERYCRLSCPQNCTCEGYAYTCWQMFDPYLHLQVRYLDLSGTHQPSLNDIYVMEYLNFLNLSSCHLKYVNITDMYMLRILDLSSNSLDGLSSLVLEKLPSLVVLNVSNNPFLMTLDASFSSFLTHIETSLLRVLMMRNTSIRSVDDRVFAPLSKLTSLDLRGNDITHFGKEIFSGLNEMKELQTDNHKLCCPYFRPVNSECHAPVDELSSCDDLLREDFFRVFIWLFSILAIVGNAGSLVYRLMTTKRGVRQRAYTVLVANLAASDFLMGVYIMIIGAADMYYRGVYVSSEDEWTGSSVCQLAGFLAFVSSEVSAFAICLITVDRFLVLCFTFKTYLHMTAKSASVACCVAWSVGLLLAGVPLMAQWEFYGQSGICLPLPITRQQYQGQEYAFSVFIVLNFFLFLLIGVFQTYIFCSLRSTRSEFGSDRQKQDKTIARRLFTVVLTDFLCWFPVGLMGLLANQGVPIPGVVNVWVAIFVLPLNSAINPFLYTINSLAERWAIYREDRRMKKLMGKLHSEIPKWTPATVEELTRICLRSKLVKKERVLQWLGVESRDGAGLGNSAKIENKESFECTETDLNDHSLSTEHTDVSMPAPFPQL